MSSMLAPLSRRPRIKTVHAWTRATAVALTLIVATGGAVRLTRSGLGCDSWPDCGNADGWHAFVEYGNRLAGAIVGVVVLVTLLLVQRLQPRRPDLRRPAWRLAAGFIAQAVLGALSVVLKLAPLLVLCHFLLSMALLAVAAVLHERAKPAAPVHVRPPVRAEVRTLAWVLVAATAVVIVLGTITTGTGPHSGADPGKPAERFTLIPLHIISMIHGNAAVLVVGLAIANLLLIRVTDAPQQLRRSAQLVVAAVAVQAVIGITQYALGLPRGVVELHLLGAAILWLAVLTHHLAARAATRAAGDLPTPAPTLAARP